MNRSTRQIDQGSDPSLVACLIYQGHLLVFQIFMLAGFVNPQNTDHVFACKK